MISLPWSLAHKYWYLIETQINKHTEDCGGMYDKRVCIIREQTNLEVGFVFFHKHKYFEADKSLVYMYIIL